MREYILKFEVISNDRRALYALQRYFHALCEADGEDRRIHSVEKLE